MSDSVQKNIALVAAIVVLGTVAYFLQKDNEGPNIPKPAIESKYSGAIYSAGLADFSSDQANSLKEIAGKEDISELDQIYLVQVLSAADSFSGDVTKVLVELAENPATTNKTKIVIAESLNELNLFSSDTAKVSKALAED